MPNVLPTSAFSNRRALIFGAAKGIGRAAALEFAHRGAAVAVADIDEDGAAQVAGHIRELGGEAVALRCDVGCSQDLQSTAAAARAGLGSLDIVMNNVGISAKGRPHEIPLSEWVRVMDINFMSIVRSNAIFLPDMLARGSGYIVNTASIAGLYPDSPYRGPYDASKAAVIALTESLALYLHPLGVRVSCFCPGSTLTNIGDGTTNWSPDAPQRGPLMPLRLAMPEDAARALADGMEARRVIIMTHEEVWEPYRRHAAAPDAFIEAKLGGWDNYQPD